MEFPDLGQRCAHEGCAQLDFLPAECSHCHLMFCKEHHLPSSHNCCSYTDNVVSDEAAQQREKWQYKCSHPECHVKELVQINCIKCHRHFCLNHRHFDQHECVREKEPKGKSMSMSAELQASKELQGKVKDDVNIKLEEAKAAGGHKAAMAHKLTLMKLKSRAKGDNSIPRDSRVFFSVDCFNRQQNPVPLDLFFDKSWTMGKVIDVVAKTGSIKNRNHLPGNPVLHIFKGETCLSNPFDKTLQILMSEELLCDGDSLSLKQIEN